MPEEQAEVLARSQATLIDKKLATKRDLEVLGLAMKRDLEAHTLATKRDLRELELRLKHDLTLRLGSMTVAAVGVVAILARFL